MAGEVWVLAEEWQGQLTDITFEVLALGRELADAVGTPLQVILLGNHKMELAGKLGKADTLLHVDNPSLAALLPELHCHVLSQLVRQRQPRVLLIPLTNATLDIAAFLPAQLGIPFINWCKNVRVVDGTLQAQSVLYGGKMEALVAVEAQPAILGILPGARSAEIGRAEHAPPIEQISVTIDAAPRVRFKRYVEPEVGDVDITQVPVLVSVGRGIQTQDNVALAEELAQALGGVVCGSRPVIDQGWLPLSRQVGKSGANVKPKLYFAVGISGAPEHVEGMKNSELIIAVNNDANAPIFNVAHYGIVGDALEVLPVLTEEVRKVTSRKAS